jgi:hypothetical protein
MLSELERSDDEAIAVAVSVMVHVDGLSEAHTAGDPIAKRSKDNWQSVGLGRQGKLSESNPKPRSQIWKADEGRCGRGGDVTG